MTDDMHRKLTELGSSKAPEPDAAFVTGLELELRSMRASSSASGLVQRRWPATVAAVTFSFAVIAFGLATIDTAPASVSISAANGAVVYMPSGAIVPAEPGLELEAGAIVQVGPGGSASISGGDQEIDLGPGEVAEVTAEGIVVPDETILDAVTLTTLPSTAARGSSSAGVANATVPTPPESVSATPGATAASDTTLAKATLANTTTPNTVLSDTGEPTDADPRDVTITEPADDTTTTSETPATTAVTTTVEETTTTSTVTTTTLERSTTTVDYNSTTTTRDDTEQSTSTSTTDPDDSTTSSSSPTSNSTSTTTEPSSTSTTTEPDLTSTTSTTSTTSVSTTTVAQPDPLAPNVFGPLQAVSETCDYDVEELLVVTRAVSDGLLSLVEAIELLTC